MNKLTIVSATGHKMLEAEIDDLAAFDLLRCYKSTHSDSPHLTIIGGEADSSEQYDRRLGSNLTVFETKVEEALDGIKVGGSHYQSQLNFRLDAERFGRANFPRFMSEEINRVVNNRR